MAQITQQAVYNLIDNHARTRRSLIVKRLSHHFSSPHYAEDVVQEAYFRACNYWATYDGEQGFNTWFSSILNNAIKDFFKEEALHGMGTSLDSTEIDEGSRLLDRLTLEELLGFINRQPERIARILNLHIIQGYRSDEVAQLVPESADNIRKIVQRFRAEVRKGQV